MSTSDPHPGEGAVHMFPLKPEHAAASAHLDASLFPEDAPWSEESFLGEMLSGHGYYLGMSVPLEVWRAVAGSEPPAERIVSPGWRQPHEVLIGCAGLGIAGPEDDPEYELRTVGVDQHFQGRHLGRRLVTTLLDHADETPGPVFLEVATDNAPAIGLYESLGFEEIGLRKNYYQPSGRDAFVMMREAQR